MLLIIFTIGINMLLLMLLFKLNHFFYPRGFVFQFFFKSNLGQKSINMIIQNYIPTKWLIDFIRKIFQSNLYPYLCIYNKLHTIDIIIISFFRKGFYYCFLKKIFSLKKKGRASQTEIHHFFSFVSNECFKHFGAKVCVCYKTTTGNQLNFLLHGIIRSKNNWNGNESRDWRKKIADDRIDTGYHRMNFVIELCIICVSSGV